MPPRSARDLLAPKLDEEARKLLEDDLQVRPFVSLGERCEYIEAKTGLIPSPFEQGCFSRGIRPPVVADVRTDDFGLVAQSYASPR